jgi:hypothetical protein
MTSIPDAIVEVLTKGWALAAVLIAFFLRGHLRGLLERLKSFEFGKGGAKAAFNRVAERGLEAGRSAKASELPAPTPTPQLPPKSPEGAAQLTTSELQPPQADAQKSEKREGERSESGKTTDDPWRRCGNIYWLGNDLAFGMASVLAGNDGMVLRALKNAAHHSTQLDIPAEYKRRLADLYFESSGLSNQESRASLINKIGTLGVEIGRYIGHQQPDFPERDAKP